LEVAVSRLTYSDIQAERLGLAHLLRSQPWAIRQESLDVLTALARHELSAHEAIKVLEPAAATQRAEVTKGAGVAVIPLRGVITPRASLFSMLFGGGGGLESFRESFRAALDDDEVSSILIDVDSPGGSVSLVAETAAEVLGARGVKPIVAIANTMAASAAYHIASAADELVITPSGFAGSIGVYIVHDDLSKLNEDIGILPTYISAGKYKVDGNQDEPLSDSAREALQADVDDFYDVFVAAVAEGRGVSEAAVRKGYGEGRTLTAPRALAAGLVDRIATYEQTVTRLLAGDTAPNRGTAARAVHIAAAAARAAEMQMSAAERDAAAAALPPEPGPRPTVVAGDPEPVEPTPGPAEPVTPPEPDPAAPVIPPDPDPAAPVVTEPDPAPVTDPAPDPGPDPEAETQTSTPTHALPPWLVLDDPRFSATR
jgi:signal peptide peptidase SppA